MPLLFCFAKAEDVLCCRSVEVWSEHGGGGAGEGGAALSSCGQERVVTEGVECTPVALCAQLYEVIRSRALGGGSGEFFHVHLVLMGVCSAHTAASSPPSRVEQLSRRDADDSVSAPAVAAQPAVRPGMRFAAASCKRIAGDTLPAHARVLARIARLRGLSRPPGLAPRGGLSLPSASCQDPVPGRLPLPGPGALACGRGWRDCEDPEKPWGLYRASGGICSGLRRGVAVYLAASVAGCSFPRVNVCFLTPEGHQWFRNDAFYLGCRE